MALNPDHFQLDTAIKSVWEDDRLLDDVSKQLICSCLPDDGREYPRGEADMDRLQLALSSCEFLNGIQSQQFHWLSDHGKSFPDSVRSFIYNTSIHFHNYEDGLPNTFIEPLVEFVSKTKSHVATLNYDNLLYKPFIDFEVLKGYNGALVDGFYASGFTEENLVRKFNRSFGYYLHLHGSPVFVNRGETVCKLSQSEVSQGGDQLSSHIVLTHVAHKKTIIESSKVLTAYWSFLKKAITESCEVTLVGYSGLDIHLNELLSIMCEQKNIRVIEWSGCDDSESRKIFWAQVLGRDVELIHLDNILDFNEW